MTAIKCFYCRNLMSPVDGEWEANGTHHCERSPNGKHARQIVLNLTKGEAA